MYDMKKGTLTFLYIKLHTDLRNNSFALSKIPRYSVIKYKMYKNTKMYKLFKQQLYHLTTLPSIYTCTSYTNIYCVSLLVNDDLGDPDGCLRFKVLPLSYLQLVHVTCNLSTATSRQVLITTPRCR